MTDRSSSRSVFRPLIDKFVSVWHNRVLRKHHRNHAPIDISNLPAAFEEEFRVASYLPQSDENWRGNILNENVYEPVFEIDRSGMYPFPYPYSSSHVCQRHIPDLKFTTSDTIFDAAYFLPNDIETIATILEQVFASNLMFLLDSPYWNYGACTSLLSSFDSKTRPMLSQLKGEPILTLGHHFPNFSDLLLSLQSDNTIQKVMCDQKKRGENLRFMQAFKFNDQEQYINEGIVPVVIVGVFCVEVPIISPYQYPPLDKDSKRTINITNRTHIFHDFNIELARLEREIARSMKEYPLFNEFNPYRGPRFSTRPLVFTNLSEYRWQLVQLTHIFQLQDPILSSLPAMLTEMYNYLSNPAKLGEVCLNPDALVASSFSPPNFQSLIRETSEHYMTPNMEMYLKQKPWGKPSLVKFPHNNINYWCNEDEWEADAHYFTELKIGDECPICLLEYKESEICLHLNCKHIFHKKCIEHWLYSSSSSRCPLCRRVNVKFGLY